MPRRSKTPAEQLDAFHRDVERLIEGRASDVSDRVIHELIADLRSYTARALRGRQGIDQRAQAALLHLLGGRLEAMSGVLVDEMGSVVYDATADADMRVARMFRNVEGQVPPELTSRMNAQMRQARRREMMAQIARQDFSAGWGKNMREQVARALDEARRNGINTQGALVEIDTVLHEAKWQVRMAAVTHAASAYNGAQEDTIRVARTSFPDIRKRWTELINDATGKPLDDRVAEDSMVLHGQAVRPDHLFTMPDDPRVPHRLVGKSWPHPPNRPNDRACITPWRPGWGIPAWELVDGQRKPIR